MRMDNIVIHFEVSDLREAIEKLVFDELKPIKRSFVILDIYVDDDGSNGVSVQVAEE